MNRAEEITVFLIIVAIFMMLVAAVYLTAGKTERYAQTTDPISISVKESIDEDILLYDEKNRSILMELQSIVIQLKIMKSNLCLKI